MTSLPRSAQRFLENEAALREKHGRGALYVRPQAAEQGGGRALVVGGWAFLDGDPAIVPIDLDLFVLSFAGPKGMASHPKTPSEVFTVLTPYVTRHEQPCPHLTFRVPHAHRAALEAQLVAPVRAERRTFYPVLKEASWPHAPLVVHRRLLPRPDAPLVTLAEDGPNGYLFLTREAAGNADVDAMLETAYGNLEQRPFDLVMVTPSIAMSGGADLTAERVFDRRFVEMLHQKLGKRVWVAMPHRVAIHALADGAPADDVAKFQALVRFEVESGPAKGHAPVSRNVFLLEHGRVLDMQPLEEASSERSSPPAGTPPRPRDLVVIDWAKKHIAVSIAMLGSGAKSFARAFFEATGGGPVAPVPPGRSADYFTCSPGPIRDWTMRFHVYALEADLETIGAASSLAADASVVLLVQNDGQRRIEPALYALANVVRDAKAKAGSSTPRILAFVGPREALATLEGEAKITPDVARHDGDDAARSVVKEVMTRFLGALKRP